MEGRVFHYLPDNRFDIDRNVVAWIRSKLLEAAGTRILVENPQPTAFAPNWCMLFSLMRKSYTWSVTLSDAFTRISRRLCLVFHSILQLFYEVFISFLFGKQVCHQRQEDLRAVPGGGWRTGIHKQLRVVDLHLFVLYTAKMLYIRNACMPCHLDQNWTASLIL